MARDRKANVWQKTAGEIKRMWVFSLTSRFSALTFPLLQDRQGWWIREAPVEGSTGTD